MRKQFLKELMEQDGDQQANADEAPDNTNANPPENNSNQPSIVVPKDPEQQKKSVQRFLYFINSIRLMMNTYTKTQDKLLKAVSQDNDFKDPEPQTENAEPSDEEDTDITPAEEPETQPEERKGLADAKKKYDLYKTKAVEVVKTLEKYKKVFADVAKQLNSFYGTIKEAPQVDIKTVMAFLQTYQNKSEFETVENEKIYPNAPTLKQIMDVYKFLNQELKKQKEIIKILTPFVGEEDKIQSPNIPQPDQTQIDNNDDGETTEAGVKYKPVDEFIANIRKNPIYNNELVKIEDDAQLKELILFIRAIRKDKVSESINEGLFSDLIDGFFGSTNYEESYDKGEAPTIKTAKDLKNYSNFIKQKSAIAFQNVPSADRDAAEEVRQEKEKLFNFIKTTDVEITDKLYSNSKVFIDSFSTINKFMNKNNIVNDNLATLSRVYGVVAAIIRIKMDDKLDVKKVFNNTDKIKNWMNTRNSLNKPMLSQLLDRDDPTTTESLMERLIKQELKVLNGKKMVRN